MTRSLYKNTKGPIVQLFGEKHAASFGEVHFVTMCKLIFFFTFAIKKAENLDSGSRL